MFYLHILNIKPNKRPHPVELQQENFKAEVVMLYVDSNLTLKTETISEKNPAVQTLKRCGALLTKSLVMLDYNIFLTLFIKVFILLFFKTL